MKAPKKQANRKYYQASQNSPTGVAEASQFKMFLVRFQDEDSNRVETDGPYTEEEEANRILNSYLKQGICSWLVSYNG